MSLSSVRITTSSERETQVVARVLGGQLQQGNVVTLDGPLGSGKTCFVRGLASGLGIDPHEVSSPTFVLCQEYGLDRPIAMAHIDAYRLGGPEELDSIGFDELVSDGVLVVVIEWADRIRPALPQDVISVSFEHLETGGRQLTIDGPPAIREAIDGIVFEAGQRCRICQAAVTEAMETFPFCSTRCRQADMGRWFDERYRVSRPAWQDPEA